MKTKISKWGNSLALRIPSRLAASHHLAEGSDIEIVEDADGLKLCPIPAKTFSLDELLAGITEETIHGEFDTGLIEGKEHW